MKLISLSGHPNKPCNVLKFKDTMIMLDCGLDASSVSCFLPVTLVHSPRLSSLAGWSPRDCQDSLLETELKEVAGRVFIDSSPEFSTPELSTINLKHIDAILISNYICMLGLPYITERTDFSGVVYATEPTIQIARQFMEEIITYVERTPKIKQAFRWKQNDIFNQILLPVSGDSINPCTWQQMYTTKEMNNSLSKVKIIAYSEKINLFGSIQVTALSSGFCIGSCNWMMNSSHEKIVYLSSSSTLTTHPKPMDQAPLKNADVMILNNLTQTPLCNPDAMLGELCSSVTSTLRSGGNVLIPCYSSGVIFDLFECLVSHLEQSGFSSTQLFFLSPVADQSLAYSNILAEWLTQNKQAKVYLPEEPFPHSQMVRLGKLKHFPGVHVEAFNNEYKYPCIVFTGHPSLRFGDAVHFVELWGPSSNNLIVFTEPDFPYLEALAPYQPLSMKVVYCPIDTGLSFSQANKLIRELKPNNLIVPFQYMIPPMMHKHRNDLVIEAECSVFTYKRNDVIKLPLKRKFEKVEIDSDMATNLQPVEIKSGISVATVTGTLIGKDNKFVLQTLTKAQRKEIMSSSPGHTLPPMNYTWGSLDLSMFMQKLSKAGIYDATVEQTPTGYIVHLRSEEAFITIDEASTHIVCDSNSNLRCTLRDLVVQCLKKF